MKRLIQLFLALLIVHSFCFLQAQNTSLGIKKIVIDPHTAVGIAAEKNITSVLITSKSITAHPSK